MTERVTLFRMRRPSDNGEVACFLRSDETGLLHLSLTFNGYDLPALGQSTRVLANVVRFGENTRRNLLNAGWHDSDDQRGTPDARIA